MWLKIIKDSHAFWLMSVLTVDNMSYSSKNTIKKINTKLEIEINDCYSNSSEKPSANAGVKTLKGVNSNDNNISTRRLDLVKVDKKKTYWIVDFTASAGHRKKSKVSEKSDKYLHLA